MAKLTLKPDADPLGPGDKLVVIQDGEIKQLDQSDLPAGMGGGGGGEDGEDGASAYEIAVDNGFVGDEAAWLASLVGADGEDGEDGQDGEDGEDGTDGEDGLSAYEIAIENGFVGDEAAWLASLVGEDGSGGGSSDWGAIGGDLEDQADLAAALGDKQASHANLTAMAGLGLVADRLPYANGAGTLALATFTAAGRALIDDADANAQLTTLGGTTVGQALFKLANPGAISFLRLNANNTVTAQSAANFRTDLSLVVGTNVQAFHANLTAMAGLGLVADRLPYANGAGTLALATFTAAGRALIDDADANAQLTTLGGTTVGQALFKLANPGAISFLRLNADNTVTAQSAANFRTDLSLVVGTNVQAYHANLASLAGLALAGNGLKGVRVNSGGTALELATISASPAGSSGQLQYNNASALGGALLWQNSNTIEQRNSTTAQTLDIFNTWTDASNNEFLRLSWGSNIASINTGKLGTGTARDLYLGAKGTTHFILNGTEVSVGSDLRPNSNGSRNFGGSGQGWGTFWFGERSTDPSNPSEGSSVIWQADGVGAGDDGDIMFKITAGGVTKTGTLIDFSAF